MPNNDTAVNPNLADSSSHGLRNILLIVLAIIVTGVSALYFPGPIGPITSVANSINIPTEWDLVTETVNPPRLVCGDVTEPCPSVQRAWSTTQKVDSDVLENILKSSHVTEVKSDEICLINTDAIQDSCTAQGKIGKYKISLTLRTDETVILNIHEQ